MKRKTLYLFNDKYISTVPSEI